MDSTSEKTHASQPVDTPALHVPHKDSEVATPPSSGSSAVERHGNTPAAQIANGEKREGASVPNDETAATAAQPERSTLKIALIMFSLAVAVLLVALDITIITTALPTISSEFNSASGYTWVGSAYLIAQSAATPIWGKVSDIFGRKPILLVTNGIFFVGSLLAGVSVNIDMLIAAR
jgi:hypothetical protein